MIKKAGSKIEIVAAGKITTTNIIHVHDLIGATSYHGRKIV